MKYFKTPSNQIFAYEADGSQDHLVAPDMIQITEQEARQIIANKAQQDFDALSYSDKRAAAYPSIQEQLDMQYWDSVNGTTTWADAIAAVKQEFPKP